MYLFVCCFAASLVAFVTLRLLQPKCQIATSWCEEKLLLAARRTVSALHDLTVPSPKSQGKPLSAPAFAYCFPLLRCVLHGGGKAIGGDDNLRQEALQVMAEHCKLRSDEQKELEEDADEVRVPWTYITFVCLFVCLFVCPFVFL